MAASIGAYRFAVEEDGQPRGFAALDVAAASAQSGVVHTLRVEIDEPLHHEFTYARRDAGAIVMTRYRNWVDADSTVTCDWSVPLTVLPAHADVGASWTTHSTCDFTRRGRPGRYTRDERGTVTGRQTMRAAGSEWPVFVVRVEGTNRTTGSDNAERQYTIEYAVTVEGLPIRSVETAKSSTIAGPVLASWSRALQLHEVVRRGR